MPERPARKQGAAANRSRRRRLCTAPPSARMRMTPRPMKERATSTKPAPAPEPVGIVISRGRDIEPPPFFSAYMYAPVPDDVLAAAPVLAGA